MKSGDLPSAGCAEGGGIDEGLRQAIMTLARLYNNRGDGVAGDFREDPFVQDLFGPYRVFGL